jgi:signal transduction histidine kinase/CheY-like chemotaxis protein
MAQLEHYAEHLSKAGQWGVHYCHLYETKQDLVDLLVPYFKAGLANHEVCVWITSSSLPAEEARALLEVQTPELQRYVDSGQFQIIDYANWYVRDGVLSLDEVLKAWDEKEREALAKGFKGLRVTGDTCWLNHQDWSSFQAYEGVVNDVIRDRKILAVCSYPLQRCGGSQIMEIIFNHQYALLRRNGRWQRIESADYKQEQMLELFAARDNLEAEVNRQTERIRTLNEDLERKVAERTEQLAKSQQAFFQAQKMQAVGLLAGGIAHDFNNLITGILGVSRDIQQSLPVGDPRTVDLEDVIEAANRAFNLTRQLLTFARRQTVAPAVIKLNDVILELDKMLRRLIGEDIVLRTELDPHLPNIIADQGHVEQVLTNLILNARDAMPNGGTVVIKTQCVDLTDSDRESKPALLPGRYAQLSVTDTGMGMTAETIAQIFQPFYTTKKEKGTGLGLSTVYGIVKQSGGDIEVHSTVGEGSTLRLLFPAGSALPRPVAPATEQTPVSGKETILVVEDEALVCRVVVKKLQQRGYRVLQAYSGREALRLSQEFHGPIDLLLTDVVMPHMNGQELAHELKPSRPDIAVLYMSGYGEEIIAHRGVLKPGIDFIDKSSIATRLSEKVRQVLDERTVSAGV